MPETHFHADDLSTPTVYYSAGFWWLQGNDSENWDPGDHLSRSGWNTKLTQYRRAALTRKGTHHAGPRLPVACDTDVHWQVLMLYIPLPLVASTYILPSMSWVIVHILDCFFSLREQINTHFYFVFGGNMKEVVNCKIQMFWKLAFVMLHCPSVQAGLKKTQVLGCGRGTRRAHFSSARLPPAQNLVSPMSLPVQKGEPKKGFPLEQSWTGASSQGPLSTRKTEEQYSPKYKWGRKKKVSLQLTNVRRTGLLFTNSL